MTHRLVRVYDIPDGLPSLRDWLDQQDDEAFFAHIRLLELDDRAPIFLGCRSLPDGLWGLSVPIGYGMVANLIFFSLKNGDFIAVHGFTSITGEDIDAHVDIAVRRKRDLI